MASVVDRWHRARTPEGAERCEHDKVPTADHGCSKRWQVRWRDDAGKQRATNYARKGEADRRAVKIANSLAAGDYVDPKAGRVTVRAYLEQWRTTLVLDPKSLENIDSRFKVHVFPLIGDMAMGTLARRPSLVQAWIKRMESELKLGAVTIRDTVAWVSTAFNAAIDDQVVARNPCTARSVRRPRVVRKQVVPWELARVDAVAVKLDDRYAAMVYLGTGCGLRQGELFGVGLEDVDFLGRMVRVERQVRIVGGKLVFSPPKGGKKRSVPLPDAVGLRLSAHVKAYTPVAVTLPWKEPGGEPVTVDLLFTTPRGGALDRKRFNETWADARKAAGAPSGRDNGCHVLRHTAASAWLAQGVDIRTVAEFLGHADPGFTLRTYAHLMPDATDRARKAMDAFFSAPSARTVHAGGVSNA